MAILNPWQRIDRVLPGKIWGDGKSGDATISSDLNTRATFTGTASSTSGTADSSIATDSLVLIHQTIGTGAGQWEINYVTSGGTSLIFKVALYYTYSSGAQIIVIPRHKVATISGFTGTAWNGSTGGISIICASKSVSTSGTISLAGQNGVNGNPYPAGGAGIGFRGGGGVQGEGTTAYAYSGDGTDGLRNKQYTARGNGGGGGYINGYYFAGGGGGANGGAGTNGGTSGGGIGGYGGTVKGSSDLTTMVMGGGGGGAVKDSAGDSNTASGAGGGGILLIISKNVTISNSITVNGGTGGTGSGNGYAGGGGGAGGSVLVICDTGVLGSSLITGNGGSGGSSSGSATGGAGGTGRIAVHYKTSVSGTTSPNYTGIQDDTLKEKGGSSFLLGFCH